MAYLGYGGSVAQSANIVGGVTYYLTFTADGNGSDTSTLNVNVDGSDAGNPVGQVPLDGSTFTTYVVSFSVTTGARAFTGRLFCGVCGSVFYSKKSKNDKGEYFYYNCGTRQRKGLSACCNTSSIREDQLIMIVDQITKSIFMDADNLITLTLRDAEQLMASNQTRTRDVRSQIGVLDREVRELTRLIMDPEISLEAKRAVSRQMGEKEAARAALEATLANLTQNAQQGAERLVTEVRKAVEKARHNFAGMNDPHVLNRFVTDFIGPITVTADGRLEQAGDQTETAPAIAGAVVPMNVAGGGFDTGNDSIVFHTVRWK